MYCTYAVGRTMASIKKKKKLSEKGNKNKNKKKRKEKKRLRESKNRPGHKSEGNISTAAFHGGDGGWGEGGDDQVCRSH